ncbi:nuclease-related domain-containing protein [Burkholderia sp. RS01]|uniref:nuclease-related domain-containing protein n=1 Tax=unclassified Burkholderia TaxID=2613784 RepID=UPI0032182968
MGAADGAFERTRLASERIARLKRDLDRADHDAGLGGAGVVPGSDQLMAAKLGELVPWGWLLLHDVHWPGRPLARLDHVLVGPGGVMVIGAKGWTGRVEVTDGVLRHNGYAQHPAIEVALGQAAAVAALLPASRRRFVRSLVCIAGQAGVSGTTGSGIEVHGIDTVVAAVAGMPDVLDSPAIAELYAQLGRLLTQPQVPKATGFGGRPGRVAVAKNAGSRPDGPGSTAPRASTTQPPAAGSSAQSAAAASSPAPQPASQRSGQPQSAPRHAAGLNSGFRHATVLPPTATPSAARPLYPAGREYSSGAALRSVGMALIAGFITTALLAPPLWLLWELLPQ